MKRTTLAVIALAVVPGIAAAQQDTTRTPADSTKQPATQQDSAAAQGTTPGRIVNQANESGDTTHSALRDSLLRANQMGQQQGQQAGNEQGQAQSRGGRNSSNLGLSRSQVRELQTALNSAGCDAGAVDGIVGPRTRSAIDCARTQKGISGDDNAALFQALNLNFAGGEASGRNVSPTDTSAGASGGTADTARTTTPPATTDSVSGQSQTTDSASTSPSTPTTPSTPADSASTRADSASMGTMRDSAQTRTDSTRPPR